MGAHMPMQSERLAPGRAAGEDWARIDPTVFVAEGAAFRRGPWSRRSPPVGAVSAGSTASRPWSGDCGNGSPAVRAQPGGPPALAPGRSAARRHRPAPRRHRARGRRPAGRSAGAAPGGDGGAAARGQRGRCRAPRPTAINRPRHDPFPTWPPDSRRTGWIASGERLWLSGGAGRSASRPGRRSRRRPRCCRA